CSSYRFSSFSSSPTQRALHSFPTRRSSDLRITARLLLPLPISSITKVPGRLSESKRKLRRTRQRAGASYSMTRSSLATSPSRSRSEEHTSELQSRENLVCRLLLEKKKKKQE